MATGAWSATAMTMAATVNANPFREGGAVQPKHFDPYGLLGHMSSKKPVPKLAVRIGVLKDIFVPPQQ